MDVKENKNSPKASMPLSPLPRHAGRKWETWPLHGILAMLSAYHVYLAVATYLANRFYTHDVGIIDYMIYHTWNGRFFWSIYHDRCHFCFHFTPTLILLVPFHALFRHILFIPILEVLAVCSGAWAVGWMCDGLVRRGRQISARKGLSPMGLALGWLYLTGVSTGSILMAYHFESFAMSLFLWALAALANRRWRLFWILVILSMGCKEDISLYWGLFGAWWMLFGWEKTPRGSSRVRKKILRGFVLLTVSFFCAIMAMAVVGWFARDAGMPESEFAWRYAWMGDTVGEKMSTLMERPEFLWIPLWRLGKMLLPSVLLLPILAPETLILLVPGMYIMGLTSYEAMNQLLFYYSYPFLPFLFLGSGIGIARLLRLSRRHALGKPLRAALIALIFLAGCWMVCLPTRTDNKRRLPDERSKRHGWMRSAIRENIPAKASVAAQFDLLCQIPYRTNMHPLSEANIERSEFWVLDREGFAGDVDRAAYGRILDKAEVLISEKRAEKVVDERGLLIIHRLDGDGL